MEGENNEDFCEFTSDYPDIQEIRKELRKNLSKNDKNLLFSTLNTRERLQVQSKFRKRIKFIQTNSKTFINLFDKRKY